MFLPLTVQNPAMILAWIGLRGKMAGFCAFKGKKVHLVEATAKWCPNACEKLEVALKVSESATVAYYRRNLKLFGPSRAPLGPSGGKSDHPMALICR